MAAARPLVLLRAAPRAAFLRRLPLAFARSFSQQSPGGEKSGEGAAEGMSTSSDAPDEASAGGTSDAAAAGGDELAALKTENGKLKASVQELNSARLRLLADMENVRRIAQRDVESAKAYALQGFAKKVLDVADNLQRAVAAVPADARTKREGNETFYNLYEGIAATEKEMSKTLASVGVLPFGKAGDAFDPHRHEAMMQVPATAAHPVNTISLILKPGYLLKDRVIRAAQVAVATEAPA